MYHYRQVLVRMRQGDSDRDIAKSRIMSRKKLAEVRELALARGWLLHATALPDDTMLAEVFASKDDLPASCQSTVTPWRNEIEKWHAAGITVTRIHQVLTERHGYTGSYSSVYRMLQQIQSRRDPDVPMRLEFAPGEAAQVDFGAGPQITDVMSGEIFKTWFFVMTLCWSRHQYVEMVRDQTVATWLFCHRHAFEWFGAVPARIIIDNPNALSPVPASMNPRCNGPMRNAPKAMASRSIPARHGIRRRRASWNPASSTSRAVSWHCGNSVASPTRTSRSRHG